MRCPDHIGRGAGCGSSASRSIHKEIPPTLVGEVSQQGGVQGEVSKVFGLLLLLLLLLSLLLFVVVLGEGSILQCPEL